ncbi:hypothetical protein KFE25_004172 [Diacronema lutheri]|uniref:Uncharacterized protein n=1 Tax=Diacronema lutheri TaxID=2081491 RepID=A0A8J6C3L6_DIALT|nr:hypothetical protein KFE25_004172 [Diacronema lutheri]
MGSTDKTYWPTDADVPRVYDPPQRKASFANQVMLCYVTGHRNPLCVRFPCCVAQVLRSGFCNPGVEYFSLTDPDTALERMLSNTAHPNCPAEQKAVFWMEDNIAGEVLITVQDAEWSADGTVGTKTNRLNWTRDPTCFASLLGSPLYFRAVGPAEVTLRYSPDRKWIMIHGAKTFWMRVLQADDTLTTPDGAPLSGVEPGDFMRITWKDPTDPSSGLAYQYLWKKIAWLDGAGRLVKSKRYDGVLQQAQMAMPAGSTPWCGFFNCCLTKQQRMNQYLPLSNLQYVVVPPRTASIQRV